MEIDNEKNGKRKVNGRRDLRGNVFFFNDPAPTEIYPLPLHAALPISPDYIMSGVYRIKS